MSSTRKQIFDILSQKNFAATAMSGLGEEFSSQEKGFITEVTYGVIRRQKTLDCVIEKYSSHTPKTKAKKVLQMGLYQLLFLEIPAYACIYETVELMKKIGNKRESRYVNAIMRQVQRDITKTDPQELPNVVCVNEKLAWEFSKDIFPSPKTDLFRYLSLAYSYPIVLTKSWFEQFGKKQARELLLHGNMVAPVLIRLRSSCNHLAEMGAEATAHPKIWRFKKMGPIEKLPGFAQGEWTIMGKLAFEVIKALSPKKGMEILDLCAAPGGKSFYLADYMGQQGSIIATDKSISRLKKIVADAKRLQIKCVQPVALDATKLLKGFYNGFDQVVVDGPCSNSAVFAKRVEARWRFNKKTIKNLAKLQLQLLLCGAKALKKGGELVYSTCSLEKEENNWVVEQFLKNFPSFHLENTKQILPLLPDLDGGTLFKLYREK